MPGSARRHRPGRSTYAVIPLVFAILGFQGPGTVRVGRVTAVYWPETEIMAVMLAERADAAAQWPGISHPPAFRLRLIVTPDRHTFDSVTAGRLPGWGVGVAFPGTNTIVVTSEANVLQTLRHELAHLTLRNVVGRVPRWFDEGYASRAAGEWGRLDGLRVNWAFLWGDIPNLTVVNRHLRTGAASANASYALATTAVLLLERLGGDRGLTPLMETLAATSDFDRALRRTYGMTLDQFEALWHKEVKSRYGWLLLATSFSGFWTIVAGAVVLVWLRRRRRDRVRRAALDQGWVVVEGDDFPAA